MRYNELTLEEFKIRFYKNFPKSNLEIIKISNKVNSQNSKSFIIVKDENDNLYEVLKANLLKYGKVSPFSCLNKLSLFEKELFKVFPDYKNYYEIANENILTEKREKEYIIVKTKYGLCKIKKYHLLNKVIPSIQTALDKNKYFINQAKEIHGDTYNYSKLNYKNQEIKISIICPIHGEFKQTTNLHLVGGGCPKCGFEKLKQINSENPVGWSLTNWENAGKKSKNFDSFKVYIIKCWNENEEFYKIGRTFLKTDKRAHSIPYNYEILKEIKNEPDYIFKLEQKLKKINKENKYIPKIKFDGMQECFFKINIKDL
jgi:hypothetical protein